MGLHDEGQSSSVVSSWLTPVLMIYYLCCWPGDSKSDTSSENCSQRRRSTVRNESVSRRSSHVFGHRIASSAVSLHLPSTSGSKKEPLSAHRSHEDIGRRKSHHGLVTEESRYHSASAPSVIDEVIHRRDWERSTKELYIPLKPETLHDTQSISSDSLDRAPHAEPESSSDEQLAKADEQIKIARTCKKHYKNIKSSKGKERQVEEDKDCDATEESSFYIGDNDVGAHSSPKRDDILAKSIYKAKEAKQCFNESIRSKERPRQTLVPLEEHQTRMFGFWDDVIEQLESLDRSGAMHHSIESRISLSKPSFPPPSVEAVGYEGGACYLAESGSVSELRGSGGAVGAAAGAARPTAPGPERMRARHASDGDILAPPHRPESGAFSESDLDLELDGSEDLPPAYDELKLFASPERKETAI